jgi:hypothetical protein
MSEGTETAVPVMAEPSHDLQRASSRVSGAVEEVDEGILAEFGYKQELRRDWGLMHNFGISFSIIVSLKCPFGGGRAYS